MNAVVACSGQPKRSLPVIAEPRRVPGDRHGAQHDYSGRQRSCDWSAATHAAGAAQRWRPVLSLSNPAVLEDLRRMVEPTVGIRCAHCCGFRKAEKLASALRGLNHAVSANAVGKMLISLGYSR
jgi:hypothetical protein